MVQQIFEESDKKCRSFILHNIMCVKLKNTCKGPVVKYILQVSDGKWHGVGIDR